MNRTILKAAEGMVYTDGRSGGKEIYLAEGADGSEWYEIPEQEYLHLLEQGLVSDEASVSDYRAALMQMGVAL